MSKRKRALLYLASAIVALVIAYISGTWEPAMKLLHRWFPGVLITFLVIHTILVSIILRTDLLRSIWVIPITAILAYPSGTLAYLLFFSAIEPHAMRGSLFSIVGARPLDLLLALFFWGPTITFVWFYGGILGAILFLGVRCLAEPVPKAKA